MEEKEFLIGIDLGGTNIKIALLNRSYEILARTAIATEKEKPYETVIENMGKEALSLVQKQGFLLADCLGVGVGSPGTIDSKQGIVLYSNNIAWENVPLKEELKKYLPLPIYLNNDANCAALGEVAKGAAQGCSSAVFFTLGTGVGGGIVLNGKIFEGAHPGGAELGHIRNGNEGRLCTCGRYDCLETYASATALIADAKQAAMEHEDSILKDLCDKDLDKMNAKIPFDAAAQGDTYAKEIIEKFIEHLADGIVDVINIFRPDKVILGGGVCAQGEILTKPINEYVRRNCFGADLAYLPEIVIAKNGNDAGVIGAASLVER